MPPATTGATGSYSDRAIWCLEVLSPHEGHLLAISDSGRPYFLTRRNAATNIASMMITPRTMIFIRALSVYELPERNKTFGGFLSPRSARRKHGEKYSVGRSSNLCSNVTDSLPNESNLIR